MTSYASKFLLQCLFTIQLLLCLANIADSLPRYRPQPWSPYCPEVPVELYGRIHVNRTRFPSMAELERTHPEVAKGGEWRPKCLSRNNVAILIPYRDQSAHLRGFLANMLPLLERQQAHFKIFVIEQAGDPEDKFNRAKLLNAGFDQVMSLDQGNNWDCVIFSDVDMIPENDMNLYRCNPEVPVHLYSTSDEFQYRKSRNAAYDRVVGFTPAQFKQINGYSNFFWGWEGAEADLYNRALKMGYTYEKPSGDRGFYTALGGGKSKRTTADEPISKACYQLLTQQAAERAPTDGINSLDGFYRLVAVEEHKLYTKISVDLMMDKSRSRSDDPCGAELGPSYSMTKDVEDPDNFRI